MYRFTCAAVALIACCHTAFAQNAQEASDNVFIRGFLGKVAQDRLDHCSKQKGSGAALICSHEYGVVRSMLLAIDYDIWRQNHLDPKDSAYDAKFSALGQQISDAIGRAGDRLVVVNQKYRTP